MDALRELALQQRGDQVDLAKIAPADLAEFPQQAFIAGFRKYTT
jgi:hypothetical protein